MDQVKIISSGEFESQSELEGKINYFLSEHSGSTLAGVCPTNRDNGEGYDAIIKFPVSENIREFADFISSIGGSKRTNIATILYENMGKVVPYSSLGGDVVQEDDKKTKKQNKLRMILAVLKPIMEKKGYLMTSISGKGYRLEKIIDFDSVNPDQVILQSERQKKLFQALYGAKGEVVSYEVLYNGVVKGNSDIRNNETYIRPVIRAITSLREKISETNFRIVCKPKQGYRLVVVDTYQKSGAN